MCRYRISRLLLVALLCTAAFRPAIAQGDDGFLFVFNQPTYAPGDTAFFSAYFTPGVKKETVKKQIVRASLVDSRGEIVLTERFLFENGIGIGQLLLPKDLQQTTYHLLLFVETGKISNSQGAHRLKLSITSKFLKLENDFVNRMHVDTSLFKVAAEVHEYKTRDKVKVTVEASSHSMNQITFLTAAVYKEELFPSLNITTTEPYRLTNDNDKLPPSEKQLGYPYYFIGRMTSKSTNEPVPDSSKITFYLNESDVIYSVYTRFGGYFSFPLFRNFQTENLFFMVNYKGQLIHDGQVNTIEPDLTTHDMPADKTSIRSDYLAYSITKRIIDQSYDYFRPRTAAQTSKLDLDDTFEADQEVNVGKYESFSTMEEVIMNVVPLVKYRQGKIRMFLKRLAKYATADPLYIIDGVMTDKTAMALAIDPDRVKKIGILRSQEALGRFGDLGLNGILTIETDDPDDTRMKLMDSSNNMIVQGISEALSYKQSGTIDPMGRVPNLRPSLYWHAQVPIKEKFSFEFSTSDDTGYYTISIVGVQNGSFVISRSRFLVRN